MVCTSDYDANIRDSVVNSMLKYVYVIGGVIPTQTFTPPSQSWFRQRRAHLIFLDSTTP
jgi:hypothetical protein